jgi:DNA-directed RNA polymerase subunit beta'
MQVVEIGRQYTEGLITQGEKYNKVVDIWAKATDDVANEMMDAMKVEPLHDRDGNPRLDDIRATPSGGKLQPHLHDGRFRRRGSKDQMRQLAGMRGTDGQTLR